MTVMQIVELIVVVVIGLLFTAGAVLTMVAILRGPSVIDRMIGSDTLMTIAICVLSADMALRGHLDTLPVVLALASTASIGTIAVARFVSRGSGSTMRQPLHEDGAGTNSAGAAGAGAAGAAGAGLEIDEEVLDER